MPAPLAALAVLVSLVAGSPAATAGTEAPTAAVELVATAAPALAEAAGRAGLAGSLDHSAFDAPTPTDEGGCLLQPAGIAAPPSLDLRRPRLDAAAVPETPHRSLRRRRRRADRGADLFDLHLVRPTKDRGS